MRKRKSKSSFCQVDHLELRQLLSATIYVSAAATGSTHDGASWATAFTDLQSGLTAAAGEASSSNPVIIEVGQGTYYPTTGSDRTATFQLIDDVSIQGGYAGAGQANPDAHNVTEYPTILSGDIGAPGVNTDNSYHVVTGSGTDSTAVLDGFTVTDGNASANSGPDGSGGGIYDNAGSPTIDNCAITGNTASYGGGGIMDNNQSSPTLTNCTLTGNTAEGGRGGGAMANYEGSSPTLTNCTLSGNTSQGGGGGMTNSDGSSPTLTNCTLSGNTADGNGGGMYNYSNSSPTLTNCTLTGNTTTDRGGGMYNYYNSSPTLTNCTISGNTAGNGGGIYSYDSSVTLANSILWGDTISGTDNEIVNGSSGTNTVTVTYSDIDGGYAGAGNINSDPLFVDAGSSDFQLQGASPAINAGSNAAVSGVTTDLAGNPRIADGTVDMGAYEYIVASRLVITTQPANAVAGATMSAITVDVEDQYGDVVTSDASSITLTGPSNAGLAGTLTEPVVNGAATFSDLSLTTAGSYTLAFGDTDNGTALTSATSDSFAIASAAPATLVITQQPASTLAGQNIPIQIEVEDQYGNAVNGASVTLALAGSAPSGAILAGTLTEPTADGIATFSDLSLNRAGTFTLSASDGNLPAVTSQSFAIAYAGPQLVFASEPASAVAGGKLPAFTIDTDDTAGNIVTGGKSKITLTLSSGGKIYGSAKATVNKKTGMATFKNISLHTAGTYTLTAADSSYASGISTEFTISAGAAKKLAFNPQPTNAAANTPFNVSVELLDQYGNAVDDGSTVNLAFGSHPKTAAALNLASTVTDGSADFDSVTLDTAGPYTLKANDGKAKVTSKKFVVS